MLHKLRHFFKSYNGKIVSKIDPEGNIWIGFQCSDCGKIEGWHKTKF